MELKTYKSDFILLLVALIWGLAFVAQRMGMDHVGPYTFNGLRFALGGLSLVPFLVVGQRRRRARNVPQAPSFGEVLKGSLLAGVVLFAGASLQQIGLVYTTAGKAGFITGLYVILVPVFGLILGQKTNAGTWLGGLSAALPIFYGGVFSVGIAYSLQIYGQKGSHPAHAAILMSLESLVAALGGCLILNEVLSGRAVLGCILMMAGMLLSQLYVYMKGGASRETAETTS